MGIFGIGNKEVLYFPGCYSLAFLPDKVENYKRILKKLSIKFDTLSNINCCGGFLEEAGYEKELRQLAKKNHEILEKNKTLTIISNCALCLKIFSERYSEIISSWNISSEHIILPILRKIRENRDLIKNYSFEEAFYYDSCYLGRYSPINEQFRELLNLIGYKISELPKNKEETLCCGSCGNLPISNPELASRIAEDFIKVLKRSNVKRIIVSDPHAYKFLRESLERMRIMDVEIKELSEVLCDALGILREK